MAAVACLICTHILRAEKETLNKSRAEISQTLIKLIINYVKKIYIFFKDSTKRGVSYFVLSSTNCSKDVKRGGYNRKV